ncbi:MAG: type II secretion system protein [Phycisphaerae bacterium]|nr:type II secretion system protein [Phycisphaerae bacterium]
MRLERGFSLIDLLVSISVMVILMAILMPAVRMAHESARRVRCLSNIHQVGIAVGVYTDDHRGYLPPARFDEEPPASDYGRGTSAQSTPPAQNQSQEDDGADTMFLRYRSTNPFTNAPLWDGLGILIGDNYVNHPGVFYCPSHHGEHPFNDYANEWVNGGGTIAGNYQYRIPPGITRITDLDRKTAIVADGMRTRLDYNHVIGNNFLKSDLSVGWYADVDGYVYQSLPERPRVRNADPRQHNPWQPMDDQY